MLAPRRVQDAQPQALQPGRVALRGRQRLSITCVSRTSTLSWMHALIASSLLSSLGHAAASIASLCLTKPR